MEQQGIIEYVQRCRSSFAQVPLSDVDSLILSSIAYLNFEIAMPGHVPSGDPIPLPLALCGMNWDDLVAKTWLSPYGGKDLLQALVQSPRFMQLSAGWFVNDVRAEADKQFSAITFFLPDGSAYMAVRGTDNSLTGWKEDFNLSFMDEVPSHVSAREYLECVAAAKPRRLYVGGHSKGGNIAEYAVSTCSDAAYDLVTCVFNHDGPGFMNPPGGRFSTKGYADKLRKTVPEFSLFGMLMESRENYRVVQSENLALAQHTPTNWVVSGDDFVDAPSRVPVSVMLCDLLNRWGRELPPQKRELLFDTLFDMLRATGMVNWVDANERRLDKALSFAGAAIQLDPAIRSELAGIMLKLGDALCDETVRRVRETAKLPDGAPSIPAKTTGQS